MASTLDFVNRVRCARGLSPIAKLELAAESDSCVLECAFGAAVGGSEDPGCEASSQWVLHAEDAYTAERIARVTGAEWRANPAEVVLPHPVVDLVVSQHFKVLVGDDAGWVRGWWVPDRDGPLVFLTPTDELLELPDCDPPSGLD